MKSLRLILGDQLSESIASLVDYQEGDVVILCEVMEEATYVKHHPKKIAFIFAAMRHFAADLESKGYSVRYTQLTDPENAGSLSGEIARAIAHLQPERLIVTEPGEYRIKEMMQAWSKQFNLPVEVREDQRFLCSIAAFQQWASGKKQVRMEYFYREMRKKYNLLMDEHGKPEGGQWNYDKQNRKPPGGNLFSGRRKAHKKSAILQEVLTLVKEKFSDHFGELLPFHYAVTRQQALLELDDFLQHFLPEFGDYQDAMMQGEPYLNHSLLSSYINIGLLLPLEICKKVEEQYRKGLAPLNAAEGFIRQIIGWREYVRGIYWLHMPEYGKLNYLQATAPLPSFYWGAKIHMTCIAEAVSHTKQHAYSHHIQRLMITGNFALLAGLDVQEVQNWYLAVYSDAYEWVEMPNTLGMALFGDGGILGSKPYAASGKYIHKMSNFCQSCFYDSQDMLSEKACPFNALYWDFLARNRSKLQNNPRLAPMYRTWDNFDAAKQTAIRAKAKSILATFD